MTVSTFTASGQLCIRIFRPGTLSRIGIQKSGAAEALSRAKLEIARRGLASTVSKRLLRTDRCAT